MHTKETFALFYFIFFKVVKFIYKSSELFLPKQIIASESSFNTI